MDTLSGGTSKGGRLQGVLGLITTLCALIVTGVVLYERFGGGKEVVAHNPILGDLLPDSTWQAYSQNGWRIGQHDAKVTIVEFGDFQCPACRAFEQHVLVPARAAFPSLAVVFRHMPLPYHDAAMPAAIAAECAGEQGRFAEFHDRLYRLQGELRSRVFPLVASESGVPDTARFRVCLKDRVKEEIVGRDARIAAEAGFHGTPTLFVNGRQFVVVPDSMVLFHVVDSLLKSRPGS